MLGPLNGGVETDACCGHLCQLDDSWCRQLLLSDATACDLCSNSHYCLLSRCCCHRVRLPLCCCCCCQRPCAIDFARRLVDFLGPPRRLSSPRWLSPAMMIQTSRHVDLPSIHPLAANSFPCGVPHSTPSPPERASQNTLSMRWRPSGRQRNLDRHPLPPVSLPHTSGAAARGTCLTSPSCVRLHIGAIPSAAKAFILPPS